MELNGRQQQQFQQALLSAFPSKAKLAQLLSFELDWQLEAIAGGQNLSEIVFSLIQHAKAEGQAAQLITAALSQNPGNPALKAFAASLPASNDASAPTPSTDSSGSTQTNHGGVNFQNNIQGGTVYQGETININNGPATPEPESPASTAKTILFLASNPKDTGRLRLDQELRDIDESLRRSQKRDQFILENKGALRFRDFYRAILDHSPRIIHFSGHGVSSQVSEASGNTRKISRYPSVEEDDANQGLLLEDKTGHPKLIPTPQLTAIFEAFAGEIECVLLNACHSLNQAEAIVQHVPYVIGMKRPITDKAAIEFAIAFYDALGAGRDIPFAFDLACKVIIEFGEQDTPELLTP